MAADNRFTDHPAYAPLRERLGSNLMVDVHNHRAAVAIRAPTGWVFNDGCAVRSYHDGPPPIPWAVITAVYESDVREQLVHSKVPEIVVGPVSIRDLPLGAVVRHRTIGLAFVVVGHDASGYPIAVHQIAVTNPDEWALVPPKAPGRG